MGIEVVNEFKNFDFNIKGSQELKSLTYKTDVNFLTIFRKSMRDCFKDIVNEIGVEKIEEKNNYSLNFYNKKNLTKKGSISIKIEDSLPFIQTNYRKIMLKKNVFDNNTNKIFDRIGTNNHIFYSSLFTGDQKLYNLFMTNKIIYRDIDVKKMIQAKLIQNLSVNPKIKLFLRDVINEFKLIKNDPLLIENIKKYSKFFYLSHNDYNNQSKKQTNNMLSVEGETFLHNFYSLSKYNGVENELIIEDQLRLFPSFQVQKTVTNRFNYQLRKKLKILTTFRKIVLYSFLIQKLEVLDVEDVWSNKKLKKLFLISTSNLFHYEISKCYVKDVNIRINNYLKHLIGQNFSEKYAEFSNSNKNSLSLLKTTAIDIRGLSVIMELEKNQSSKFVEILKTFPNFDTVIIHKEVFLKSIYMKNILEDNHPSILRKNILNFYNNEILLNKLKINDTLFKFLKISKKSLSFLRKCVNLNSNIPERDQYGNTRQYQETEEIFPDSYVLDYKMIICFYNNSNSNLFYKLEEYFKLSAYRKRLKKDNYLKEIIEPMTKQFKNFIALEYILNIFNVSKEEQITYMRAFFQTDKKHLSNLINNLFLELNNLIRYKTILLSELGVDYDLYPLREQFMKSSQNKDSFLNLHDLFVVQSKVVSKLLRQEFSYSEIIILSDLKIKTGNIIENETFIVDQISTREELFNEHKKMNHCVRNYYSSNLDWKSFIFRVRHKENSSNDSTIELIFSINKIGIKMFDEIREKDVSFQLRQNWAKNNTTPAPVNLEFVEKVFMPEIKKQYKLFLNYIAEISAVQMKDVKNDQLMLKVAV